MPSGDPGRHDAVLPTEPTERRRAFWRLSPEERVATMRRGELMLAAALRWAACAPHEVPICNGEFEFIAVYTADTDPD